MIKTSKNKNVWVNVHFDLMVLNCWVWLSFGIPQMSFQLLVSPYQTKLHFSYLAPKCTLHLCKIWCNFLKNVYNWPITGLMFDIALFSDLNKPNFAINKWILCYQSPEILKTLALTNERIELVAINQSPSLKPARL